MQGERKNKEIKPRMDTDKHRRRGRIKVEWIFHFLCLGVKLVLNLNLVG
jgi:hypothetical protein